MVITKSEKSYTVQEYKNHWRITTATGGLSVDFEVDKELCKTEDELRKYVLNNELF